jgi:SAM-dependent methyltransferase
LAGSDGAKQWDAYFRRCGRSVLATRAPQRDDEYFADGRRALLELMQFVQARAPERALEIGCGDGRITKNLAEVSGSVIAMDIAPSVLDACQRNLHAARNVDFVLGSVDALTAYPDDYFDFIVSTNVLQHVPSRETVTSYIRETSRLLASGGVAVLQMRDPSLRTRIRDVAVDAARLPIRLPSFERHWRGCRIGTVEVCAAAERPGRIAEWRPDRPQGWVVIRHQ